MVVLGGAGLDFCNEAASRVDVFARGRRRGGAVIVFSDHFGSRKNVHSGGAAGNFFHAEIVSIVSVSTGGADAVI